MRSVGWVYCKNQFTEGQKPTYRQQVENILLLQKLHELFNRYDKSQSGSISKAQFVDAMHNENLYCPNIENYYLDAVSFSQFCTFFINAGWTDSIALFN